MHLYKKYYGMYRQVYGRIYPRAGALIPPTLDSHYILECFETVHTSQSKHIMSTS